MDAHEEPTGTVPSGTRGAAEIAAAAVNARTGGWYAMLAFFVGRAAALRVIFIAFALAVLARQAVAYLPWSLAVMTMGSLPRGLYLVADYRGERISYDDIVCLRWSPPVQDRNLRQLPQGTLLCKYVVGLAGDRVLIQDGLYQVCRDNGCVDAGRALPADSFGQPLAASSFAGVLPREYLWLASTRSERSFDSRYFGPVPRSAVERIVVRALWLW